MKYEHTPRPDVEHHYHIQSLIEGHEARHADREYHRNRKKALEERDEVLKDSKAVVVTDFWCSECETDFKSLAFRQIENDWTCDQLIAFYKTKCECGEWCIRLITDRHKDAFWMNSRAIARDRGNHFADTLQPHQSGYDLLYRHKNKQ